MINQKTDAIYENDFVDNKKDDADSDPFLYSLDELTPDDMAAAIPKKKSTYDIIYGVIRYVLLAVCAGVFIYSAYKIGMSLWSYSISQRMTDELSGFMDFTDTSVFNGEYTFSGDIKLSPTLTRSTASPNYDTSLVSASTTYDVSSDKLTVSVYNPNLEFKKAQMTNYTTEYKDTFAWIKVLNTRIDYPVMQGTDNAFYLNHTASGAYLESGTVFADFRNYTNLFQNFNTIMYGHNMKNGTMFNDVSKYLDEKFFMDNPTIELYTTDGIYIYEIFSIYQATYTDDYIRTDFSTHDEFVTFAESLEARSFYSRGDIKFNKNDHILTLSTCTNGYWQNRYALHARLVSYEK
jgi:sortase, SrtB family